MLNSLTSFRRSFMKSGLNFILGYKGKFKGKSHIQKIKVISFTFVKYKCKIEANCPSKSIIMFHLPIKADS